MRERKKRKRKKEKKRRKRWKCCFWNAKRDVYVALRNAKLFSSSNVVYAKTYSSQSVERKHVKLTVKHLWWFWSQHKKKRTGKRSRKRKDEESDESEEELDEDEVDAEEEGEESEVEIEEDRHEDMWNSTDDEIFSGFANEEENEANESDKKPYRNPYTSIKGNTRKSILFYFWNPNVSWTGSFA